MFAKLKALKEKYSYQRRVRRKYIKPGQKLDPEYKKRIKAYWGPYKDITLDYHLYYSSRTGIKSEKFLPDYIHWYYIEPFYNKREFGKAIDDKNYYSLLMPDMNFPKTVVKNIGGCFYDHDLNLMTAERARQVFNDATKEYGEVVAKKSIESCGGHDVEFFDSSEGSFDDVMRKFGGQDFIVQKPLKQHPFFSEVYPLSVNTLRTISFFHNGEVRIISTVLRMGVNNSRRDNGNRDGIRCGITPDGWLREQARTLDGYPVARHPQGFEFKRVKVPGYEKSIEIIKKTHAKFPYFGFISWDFAIDPDENPIFIEFNLNWGGIDIHQYCNGPVFGDVLDEVLKEVFPKK